MDDITRKKIVQKILGNKAFSNKEKLGPGTIIAIIFITGVLFLRPSIAKIISVGEEIKKDKVTYEKLEEKKRILKSYQTQDAELLLQQQLAMVSKYLPSTQPSLATLMSLIAQARADNLQFSGLTLNPGKIKTYKNSNGVIQRTIVKDKQEPNEIDHNLNNFEIDFSMAGDKNKIENFIAKLKEISPMMRIEEFTTAFDGQEGQNEVNKNSMQVAATFKIKVYYQPDPDVLPSYDEPLKTLTNEENHFLDVLKSYLFAQYNPSSDNEVHLESQGNPNPFLLKTQ